MDFKNEKNITIFEHPLIQHKISILRDKNTGTNEFRKLVEEIAMLEVRLTEIVGTDRTSLQRFAALNAGAATAQSIFLKWDIQNADDSAVLAAIEIPCHKAG